jgi:hypothetical protein
MAAHMQAMLPGVRVNIDPEPGPDRLAFQIGTERHRMEPGQAEFVLLARLTAGQPGVSRPVFLFCGQRAITNQAATRYLARNHERLYRKHGNSSFVLLLKVVNSQAYGPDVVELVADVTRAAQTPLPTPAPTRSTHRASWRSRPPHVPHMTWARPHPTWAPGGEHNPTGAQLTFSSLAADASCVSVPLREQ